MLKTVVISSGHGKHVQGAVGILNEVDEARRVVDHLADELSLRGVAPIIFHDDTSQSQGENLDRIVSVHNSHKRDLDISVHFNAFEYSEHPRGVEVLYLTQDELAADVSEAIAACGFIDRGAKKRTDLAFLNGTDKPAILIEVCFVDSEADAQIYGENFDAICCAIANVLGGEDATGEQPPVTVDKPPVATTLPTVDIVVTGNVLIYVNGIQVGTKG
jgi:N-acetylmuramoyl-L-alanine amidase